MLLCSEARHEKGAAALQALYPLASSNGVRSGQPEIHEAYLETNITSEKVKDQVLPRNTVLGIISF